MKSKNVTKLLKQELWKNFGSISTPSEWDGNVYGGGKISQRFWEYLKAIELLDLPSSAKVLDIGGGSPQTGMGFFANLLSKHCGHLYVFDPLVKKDVQNQKHVTFIRENANYENLSEFLRNHDITHISCVSVLEHIESADRIEIFKAINENFKGTNCVVTLEYHPTFQFFDHQLTTKSLSEMLSVVNNLYLDSIHKCFTYCENAMAKTSFEEIQLFTHLLGDIYISIETPCWYPIAFRLNK